MVTLEPPIRVGNKCWELHFTSDLGGTPTFYIYVDGVLVATTTQTKYTLAGEPSVSFMVEVLDSATDLPLQVFPGTIRLCWYKVANVDIYRVDEYVASVWTERKRFKGTDGYLQFESRFLEDGQSHLFRVVPVGENGNEGTPRQFTILMVRTPDVPDVDYTFNESGNTVTIEEN